MMVLGAKRTAVRPAAALALTLLILAVPLRARPAITVAAPREGAVLPTREVIVAGAENVMQSGSLAVSLNGQEQPPAALRAGVFSFPLTLREGTNRLTLRTGSSSREVVYEVREGGRYRFHPGFLEEECVECHGPSPWGPMDPGGLATLCHSCHDRKDGAPFLHGPVGAGQCSACHDPHGSSESLFLRSGGQELCRSCHDQPSSSAHMEGSSGRPCTECHNPHGSGKKFFLY